MAEAVWFRDGTRFEPSPRWTAIHTAIEAFAGQGDHLYTEVEAVLQRHAIDLTDAIERALDATSKLEKGDQS